MKILLLLLVVSCGIKIPAATLEEAKSKCLNNNGLKYIVVDDDVHFINIRCNNDAKFELSFDRIR